MVKIRTFILLDGKHSSPTRRSNVTYIFHRLKNDGWKIINIEYNGLNPLTMFGGGIRNQIRSEYLTQIGRVPNGEAQTEKSKSDALQKSIQKVIESLEMKLEDT